MPRVRSTSAWIRPICLRRRASRPRPKPERTCIMTTLNVIPGKLRELSGKQSEAAGHYPAASSATASTAAKVSSTHGTICSATATAVTSAMAARTTACTNLQGMVTKTAEDLMTAAGRYEQADAQGADNINQHPMPS
ncbi:ESX-1 secretion-associated protein [Mycobacterium sp. CBMA293]|nr:ESX-1 secretion-associated protein [Mycolicibacterium sp. CBMA 360]MUL60375.1 ESX-1 secretion-associated protein [Mycolicibacterium sp. CBMA 335]MUL71413.1 ESX-1 secretion-associated protein [Mycolicibacterium sp. CBMA 311]MUL97029.1 ESX-1 secretion-associated protein [Mycolicibacterium sp. CBMA 230]MUM08484.1 hypothetical protein [Mycolicibacterium sp. CBMA 213]MUM14865.1 ESX-1 secretion-associated protein [Mycolicibacterium sp. CBMA 293]MUM31352.1 ESX-1 secretion-associated protein [Myco